MTKYKIEISNKVNNQEWDNNLKQNKYTTYLQTAEYTIKNNSDRLPIFIYIKNDNEEIKGQLALTIISSQPVYSTKKLDTYMKIISKLGKRGTWVGGPVINSNSEKEKREILKEFLKVFEKICHDYNLMLIDGYSNVHDNISEDYKNEFKKYNYKIKKFVTFQTNLKNNLDEIWNQVAKSARNDFSRSERKQIIVKELNDKRELLEYVKLGKKWAKTKGIQVNVSESVIEQDWNDHLSGLQKYFFAFQDDEMISGLRIGCFNGIAYTNQVKSSYTKVSSLGGPALTWNAIKWAKNNGMQIYDYSGVELPNEIQNKDKKFHEQWKGLTEYKKKWGGEEYPYFQFIKVNKKLSYKIYRILSKPDYILRNFKKNQFKRPRKEKSN
jgi:hypothetical protein